MRNRKRLMMRRLREMMNGSVPKGETVMPVGAAPVPKGKPAAKPAAKGKKSAKKEEE